MAVSVEVYTQAFPPRSGVPVGRFVIQYARSRLVANCLVAGRPWLLSGGPMAWTGWGPAPVNRRAFASNEALEIGGNAQLLFAYLEQPPGGAISGTEYLHLLETTEKSHASARLGAGITAMLAWTILGVQALHHLGQVPQDCSDEHLASDRVAPTMSGGWGFTRHTASSKPKGLQDLPQDLPPCRMPRLRLRP